MSSPMIAHLFLTTRYLVRGTARIGDQWLSLALRNNSGVLEVHDLELNSLLGGDRLVSDSGLLRVEDIVFAHEYLDLAGDAVLQRLSEDDDPRVRVSVLLGPPAPEWEVVGNVRPRDIQPTSKEPFLVLTDCEIGGVGFREGRPGREPRVPESLQKLSFAIVQRRFAHCVLSHD